MRLSVTWCDVSVPSTEIGQNYPSPERTIHFAAQNEHDETSRVTSGRNGRCQRQLKREENWQRTAVLPKTGVLKPLNFFLETLADLKTALAPTSALLLAADWFLSKSNQ